MAKNPNDLIVFTMCRKILLQIFKFRFLLFLTSFSGLTTSDVFGISPSQSDGNKTFFMIILLYIFLIISFKKIKYE